MDPNPLLVVLLKPFAPLLPEPFQYFGIEAVLAFALQFFFSMRLFRLILGQNPLAILLCSFFFLVAPPLAWRLSSHFTLSNQWLLVAALLVCFQAQERSPQAVRRFVISALVSAAVAVAIHPYLAFQVLLLLAAAVVSLLWQGRLPLPKAAGLMAALGVTSVIVAYSLGLIIAGGKGFTAWGYRFFSMNLLSPFDPRDWKSILLPRLSVATPEQYEGYNYLGVGVLALALIVLGAAVVSRRKRPSLDLRWLIPLSVCCLVLTLLALSTRVTLGTRTLVDLDPGERFSPYLGALRASGRFFWAPYYLIVMVVLAAPFLFFRKSWANLLIACALLLQIADTQSLRQWVRATISAERTSPLKSPIWYHFRFRSRKSGGTSGMAVPPQLLARRIGRLQVFRSPGGCSKNAHQQLLRGPL